MSDPVALQKRIDDLEGQLAGSVDLATKLSDAEAEAKRQEDRAKKAEQRVKDLSDSVALFPPATGTRPTPSTVYVSRERKLPKLKGAAQGKDDPDVEEWVSDMRAALKSRPMPQREAAEFVFEHLGGEAKNEVRHRPETTRSDAEEILKVIETVFGDRSALPNLFEKFYKREQGAKEGLLEYSIALVTAWGKIEAQLDPNNSSPQTKDKTLKDRLTEGVRDHHLQRELRRLNLEEPSLSFWDFRERGLKWLGTSNDPVVQSAVRETSTQPTDKTTSEILELLRKQQAAMQALKEEVKGLQQIRRPTWGDRACYRCGSRDHFIRECPNNTQEGQGRGSAGRGRGGSRGGRGGRGGSRGNQQELAGGQGAPAQRGSGPVGDPN